MRSKSGPTPDEVMAASIQKLGLKKGDVVADIGCGTCKVAMAEVAEKVYAVDVGKEAMDVSGVKLST